MCPGMRCAIGCIACFNLCGRSWRTWVRSFNACKACHLAELPHVVVAPLKLDPPRTMLNDRAVHRLGHQLVDWCPRRQRGGRRQFWRCYWGDAGGGRDTWERIWQRDHWHIPPLVASTASRPGLRSVTMHQADAAPPAEPMLITETVPIEPPDVAAISAMRDA